MKKSLYVKIILGMLIVFMIFTIKGSFAADNVINLTDTLEGTSNSTKNNTTNNTVNNTTSNKITNTANNTVLRTNNTSNYSNSTLPKTGIEDSLPAVILVVIFAISATYAYKKIQDYKNI